jgi:hypothetical protein
MPMRRARPYQLILAFILLGACAMTPQPPPPPPSAPPNCPYMEMKNDLRCTLEAPQKIVVGDPVLVRMRLTNVSPRATYHVATTYLPLRAMENPLFIVRRDGLLVDYDGVDMAMYKHGNGAGWYVTLAPGATVERNVDLVEKGYRIDVPGRYLIDLPGQIEDIYGGDKPGDEKVKEVRAGDEFIHGVVYCNRVIVDVVAR